MNNQQSYFPSGGIGEIYLNIIDKSWYRFSSTNYVKDKAIPFLKFVLDLVGVRARYHLNQRRLVRNENTPQIIQDFMKICTELIRNFIRIKNFANNLFCTGNIQAIDYCLEAYRQYLNNG